MRFVDDNRRLRKLKRYLGDIVSYGESVVVKLADVSLERFSGDTDLLHLVTYRLQCVSEATKNVLGFDPEIAVRYPEIRWSQIRGIGNRLRHEYGDVRADIVWEAVRGNDVRSLIDVANAELERYAD